MKEWIFPTFGVFVLWGFWSFIPKVITNYMNPKSAIIFQILGAIIFGIIILISMQFKLDFHPKGSALAVLAGVLGFSGGLCFLYAAAKGPISIIAVLSALYPIITIILAMLFLNETITIKQGLGIVFGIVAMALLTT